jgi:hypothetical protein
MFLRYILLRSNYSYDKISSASSSGLNISTLYYYYYHSVLCLVR